MITGAASGIGAAIAQLLDNTGIDRLILVDTDGARLGVLAASLRSSVVQLVGDVSDEAFWESADLTGMTLAVVNAGIGGGRKLVNLTFEEWRRRESFEDRWF